MSPNEYNEIKGLLIDIRNKVSALTDVAQKELLTPTEVCKQLKIGRTTYQRYVDKGVLNQVRIDKGHGGKVYVVRSELLRLIDEGKF